MIELGTYAERLRCWLLVFAVAPLVCTSLAAALPAHPRLLLNAEGIEALKARIATCAWAKGSWAELKAEAERSLRRPVALPPRGGNWSHNYVCPTHGARLNQGRQVGPWQWEHICPVGHHVLQGDPAKATLDFDGNAIAGIHGNYAQQVVNDGLIFQVTGAKRYARKARDILLAYAEQYLKYPLHDNQGNPSRGGHVASQSLTEASWLIDMAQGADLIWKTLSEAERERIAEKLLRPALEEVILPRRYGIHNIQCRQNSAIGLVGFLLGDQKLIATAIDDPAMGSRQQIEKGVLADGMWLEGSSGYHFFTVAGLWPLAEAARNCGIDLYGPKFQSMFDGPLALAMPNLVLPNFNDSGTVPLERQADYYELAFARYRQPAYLPLIARSSRRGRLAMLFGVRNLLAPDDSPRLSTRNSTASGYAILQQGKAQDATWLCLKYGPHGGGHGHPDKNSFILYAHGQIVATDAGTHAYGSPLHRDWDKTTLAHNTLIVDETSQEPATGKSVAFGNEHGVDYSITDAGPIYKGVTFTRTAALLNPQLIVFVDQVHAETARTLDLAYHQIGEWQTNHQLLLADHPFQAWSPPRVPGYTRLTRMVSRTLDAGQLALRTRLAEDFRASITVTATEPTEIITGYGILKTTEDLVPILIQRRHVQNTAFVWAISLDDSPVALQFASASDAAGNLIAGAEALGVKVHAGNDKWWLIVNPQGKRITVHLDDGQLQTEAPFTVR